VKTDTLVIGYGNELRGDDGAGPRVARAVAAWRRAGVSAIDVHQLVPELAEVLASVNRAVFVDAALENGVRTEVEPISLARDEASLENVSGHTCDPRRLLGLARLLYGHCPDAWLVTVPAADLGFREGLSPQADEGVAQALGYITVIVEMRSPL
jgi:hydrogenase maturation protease